jgi:hypothetical protein
MVSSSKPSESLLVWSSKTEDSLLVWASKLGVDGLIVLKPSVTGLTGLGFKTGKWRIGGHVVASRSLRRGKVMSRKRRVCWIDAEKLGRIYPQQVFWMSTLCEDVFVF